MTGLCLSFELFGLIRMGFSKDLVIESKVFSLVKEGSFLLIIERSWKVMNKLTWGFSTVHWFAKPLEDCLKGEKRISTPRLGRAIAAS